MTSLNILDLVILLSSRHSIYFRWVPSHIGLNGNEIADSLSKSAIADNLRGNTCLTFSELSYIKRIELNALWRISPTRTWYFGKKTSWYHQLNIPRSQQTAPRFFSGHIKSLTFQQGRKVFPECHGCETDQASPSHILNCLNFAIDEVLGNPILFLVIFGFMEMV
ncbi:RNase H domain-containing protein [Trichonephila clavipes]|nr:RNase H domain-containing protein [Trichonephila clavipes]